MFNQQKLLFQFTKTVALVILFCFTFSYQAQGEKAVKEKAMEATEITAEIQEKDHEKEFEKFVKELFVELRKEFKELEFDKMADRLGDNTILATPQGERIKARDSLGRFWREENAGGVIDVDFTLKYHYVSKVADPIEQGDDTIEHVGHAIIDYHLKIVNGGGVLTNKTGTLTLNARHPRMCEWEL